MGFGIYHEVTKRVKENTTVFSQFVSNVRHRKDVIWTSIQRFFEHYGRHMDVKTTLCAYLV